MTFRPPLKTKWIYPVVLCALASLAYLVNRLKVFDFAVLGIPYGRVPAYFMGFLAFAAWGCVMLSWTVWTARVEVDDWGVRWKEGKRTGSRKWEDISSLGLHGINIALVDRASKELVPLPFSSRKLYEALRARMKPLSPADEAILFPRR